MKVWSWRSAIEKSDLKPMTKLVLFVLANYMNEHGKGCFPSVETIAKSCGLKRRATFYNLKQAEEAGFLVKKKRVLANNQCVSNEYEASYPKGVHVDAPGGAPECTGEVHVDALGGVHADALGGCIQVHTNTPINTPTINTPIKRKKNKQKKEKIPDGPDLDLEFGEFWSLYGKIGNKKKAKESFLKARKGEISYERIIEGVRKYQHQCRELGREQQYIRHASTWLNQDGWDDEYPVIEQQVVNNKSRHQRAKEALGLE